MEDNFEVRGDWWLPEQTKNKIPGILKFSLEHSASLELFGNLRDPFDYGERAEEDGLARITMTDAALERSAQYPRLHGQVGGTAYTLEDCFRVSSRILGGRGSELIRVNRILRGAFFEEKETLAGTGVSFRVAHLNDWIGETGIEEQWSKRMDRAPLEENTPKFKLEAFEKPSRQVVAEDSRTVLLKHSVGIEGNLIEKRSLTQDFYWRIESGQGKVPLDELLDWASDLQDLVSIASRKTANFEYVRFWHPDIYRQLQDGQTVPEAIDMFAQWMARPDRITQRLHKHDLLFTFQHFGELEGVKRWMDAAGRHRDALGRVMGSRYAKGMFVSDRLLNCAAALEGFDRTSSGHTNSKFKTRLGRCVSVAGAPFAALVGDTARWAEAVRLNRDDIAHHFGRSMRKTGSETLYLGESLYFLFVMCMLRTCSAPEEVFDHLQRHGEYRWLAPRVQSVT